MIDWSIIERVPKNKAELEELMANREWRLNNLYFIRNKDGQRVIFKMNGAQRKFHEEKHNKNINLKARQMGFTTYIQIYGLDKCLFTPDHAMGVIAHTKNDAQTFFKDKIKFAYDNLPDNIKKAIPATSDSAMELSFSNGSKIIVGVSLRSGTYQTLHVSEYGKLSAKDPEKAKEVKSGALNTVPKNGEVFIESTAEGRTGVFYDMCQISRKQHEKGEKLTPMDYKFHFFPWYEDPSYQLNIAVRPTNDQKEYFDNLERANIKTTKRQRNWYIKKSEEQGDVMKQEFPSTPDEAFEQSMEGAYFAKQMSQLRKGNRLRQIPIDPIEPIHTFWDLGRDTTSIWFFQKVGFDYRFIDYFENSGEGMEYYIHVLKERNDNGRKYNYGICWLPHDGSRKSISAELSPQDILWRNGFEVSIVPRTTSKSLSIERARQVLPQCWFDDKRCAQGIIHLDSYRKEWDDKLGTWKRNPLHDEHSHGADAFMTFADGYDVNNSYDDEDYDDGQHEYGRSGTTGY